MSDYPRDCDWTLRWMVGRLDLTELADVGLFFDQGSADSAASWAAIEHAVRVAELALVREFEKVIAPAYAAAAAAVEDPFYEEDDPDDVAYAAAVEAVRRCA